MKILYNPAENSKQVVKCYFCTAVSYCGDFELQLGKGRYEYHGCTSGFLDLPEVEENKPWILKIYRRKAWLMMDLDGVNRLKLDTLVESCSETWTGHISMINFHEVSEDVVTHYRIAAQQDFTGKIYVSKLSVSKGGYKGGTDLTGKGDLAGKEYTKLSIWAGIKSVNSFSRE